ncbi:AAA-ATPase At3g50940-like [Miscanthus floridulus]|uniref:AAA-ATPase At3g50940-like n=1 Tax=Miscanthus floridulus TaxID=154761 RepID=UPI00345B485C
MDPSKSKAVAASLPSYGKVLETYKKAAATAATVTAYAVLARGMARELLPDELREAARWAADFLLRGGAKLRAPPQRRSFVIKRFDQESRGGDNGLFADARAYLATRIDPHATTRVCIAHDGGGRHVLSLEAGDRMTDVFEGVKFTWMTGGQGQTNGSNDPVTSLELTFDAEHTDMALKRYIPFIAATAEAARRRERTLKIFSSDYGSWRGSSYHHPATFDTLAMALDHKRSIIADLDRFLKSKDYYRRIGKAWKRGYLLYGPRTGKTSLVTAMACYRRFNLYDLDLSKVDSNSSLQRLLTSMSNKCILVIEDIDCCFSATSRGDLEKSGDDEDPSDASHDPPPSITLSGLLNFIDGLWSTSGEERIIVFTTNYKDHLDPALLRPGRMDMHVYMGYCGWEAFKTLALNYFLVDDHVLFPEIQELLSAVEVTPAEVSEMLLRSEDVDVALQGLKEFLEEKKQGKQTGDAGKA